MKSPNFKILSGALLVAGTTIGAGMLGIPLVTAKAGFIPAMFITLGVWLYMYLTGLLFLEAKLWMHKGSHILSITRHFLGKEGRWLAGVLFIFLYFSLMIAYFAAGAPIFGFFLSQMLGMSFSVMTSLAIFALFFGIIVAIGMKLVDRANYILMLGLIITYLILIIVGFSLIKPEYLSPTHWKSGWLAIPVLFSSFGYHNVIPSLADHFQQNKKIMQKSLLYGTLMAFIFYALWQWMIIGAIDPKAIEEAIKLGQPITFALQSLSHKPWLYNIGQLFGLFAIVTSLLGVAFSMVDFMGDGLKMRRTGMHRVLLCILTFVPPLIFTLIDPSIFLLAIGIAGGFGEAFLNGILPAWLVWVGRFKKHLKPHFAWMNSKIYLTIILLIGFLAMIIEAFVLIYSP